MSNWFASPASLWLGLLIGPLLLLYMLRHKPVRKRVPSVMLWTGVARMQVATSPFQRLRRSMSLLLMLLALTALVLALSGFRIPGGQARGLSLTLVVDVTASMGADTRGGRRLDVAIARAREVIDAAGSSDVAVMAWDGNLRAVAPGDVSPGAAQDALDKLEVAHRGGADHALIRDVDRVADGDRRVVLITDHVPGSFEHDVLVIPAGGPALNAGIVSASLSENISSQVDLFFGVDLVGTDRTMSVPFRLERVERDGTTTLADARDVTLQPGRRASVTFRDVVPGLYMGRLKLDDAFELDNSAWLRFSRLPRQPVVLTPGTPAPVVRVARAIEESMGLIRIVEGGREDRNETSYVFAERASTGARPRLPSAYLAPAAAPPGVLYGTLQETPGGATRPVSSFLWRGAGVPDIRLTQVYSMESTARLNPMLHAGEHSAIWLLQRDSGLHDLIVAAPLDDAPGFTGKHSFVIFWANWFDYVRRSREPLPRGAVSTAQTVRVPEVAGRDGFRYGQTGRGRMQDALPGHALRLERAGVYEFSGLEDTDLPLLGVGLLDAGETDIARAPHDDYSTAAMTAWMESFEGRGEHRDLNLTPWLALLAAALLLFDWFWFRRRFPMQAAEEHPPRDSKPRRTSRVSA